MPQFVEQLAAALASHQQGRLDEASAIYREIIAADPNHADAHHLLGLIAHQQGDHEAACAGVERAIALDDRVLLYHANFVRILTALGRYGDALAAARRALALEPDNAEVLSDLAGALLRMERSEEALSVAARATAIAPDLEAARRNLALAHLGEGRSAQAKDELQRAETHYAASLKLDPTLLDALVNLGNVFRLRYRLDDAMACYEAAITKAGDIPEVHANLGVVRQEMGDTAAAIACYDRALRLDPDNPEVRRNRAQALLKGGNFEDGWREFEWRWRTAHFAAFRRDWKKPRWQGEALNGETVLVHAEQGFGDSLQFARYLPMIAARGARVVVECPANLGVLISGVSGVAAVSAYGTALPKHDYQIPMMSLPGVFASDFDNMPNTVPYLSVAERHARKWRERLAGMASAGDKASEPNIGLVWRGSANHQRNAWRSPGLAAFAPLLDVPGFRFFSLQKDDEAADMASAALGEEKLVALGTRVADFNDTAAAILNLDLVISPDTAVAHLAGALGRPVWLVLPFASEWRWFEGRDDSPWYPTMRLFHQPTRDDWAGAVYAMTKALETSEF